MSSLQLAPLAITLLVVAGCDASEEPATAESTWQEQLEALGYVTSTEVDDNGVQQGVTLHDREAASPGLNVYNSRSEAAAVLMSMDGEVVHRWQSSVQGEVVDRFRSLLPGERTKNLEGWNHIELLPDGHLLVIGSHHMLLKLDWDSNVAWKLDLAAHHDVAVDRNGTLHVLVDRARSVEIDGESVLFQDNDIVSVSSEGKILDQLSLYDAFHGSGRLRDRLVWLKGRQKARIAKWNRTGEADGDFQQLYAAAVSGSLADHQDVMNVMIHAGPEDIFHSNSLQVLTGETPLWRDGDFLVSILGLNMLAVIDHQTRRLRWTWGATEFEKPHHATQLANGDILAFDNGVVRESSRILRMDPRRRSIRWVYEADPPKSFFSLARGGAQELPNGNVLITESDNGRAFEVTRAGAIVWEFYNHVVERQGQQTRDAIYRMTRVDASLVAEQLGRQEAADP